MNENTITLKNGTVLSYTLADSPKPEASPKEDEAIEKCFNENAWFFFCNRQRIYSDSRLFLARVPQMWGDFSLGGLLEYWEDDGVCVGKDQDGKPVLFGRWVGSRITDAGNVIEFDEELAPALRDLKANPFRPYREERHRYGEALKVADAMTVAEVRDFLAAELGTTEPDPLVSDNEKMRIVIKCMNMTLFFNEHDIMLLESTIQRMKAYIAHLKHDEILDFRNRQLAFEEDKKRRIDELNTKRLALRKIVRQGDKSVQREYQNINIKIRRIQNSEFEGWFQIWPWSKESVEEILNLSEKSNDIPSL